MLLTYTTDSDTLNLDDIRQAANLFLQDYSLDTAPQLEIAVHFVSDQKNLSCVKEGNSCTITCREPAHFFKAFNMVLHHLEEDFHVEETPNFTKNGFMLDCSRNAAASVLAVKRLIHMLARAGMNQSLYRRHLRSSRSPLFRRLPGTLYKRRTPGTGCLCP